ncbi:hypothetical protein ABW20_dc0105281 [Dactylellina cionopaga]|nr:hypothetical protein ABW20_dc0105281 [Dactylellina cionopaga]
MAATRSAAASQQIEEGFIQYGLVHEWDVSQFSQGPHKCTFPLSLWQNLLEWNNKPLSSYKFPTIENSKESAKIRLILLGILRQIDSTIARLELTAPGNSALPKWRKRQVDVRSAIGHLESWQLADKDAASQCLPTSRSIKSTSDWTSNKSEAFSIDSTRELAFDFEEVPEETYGIELRVHVLTENPWAKIHGTGKKELRTIVTLHNLSHLTPVTTILRILGATQPKTDFLEFRRFIENAGRDSNGIPFILPPRYGQVGWPGGSWTNGEKLFLEDFMRFLSPTKPEGQTWDLECVYKRAWMDVEDLTKEIHVSGAPKRDLPLVHNTDTLGLLVHDSLEMQFHGFKLNEEELERRFVEDCNAFIELHQVNKDSYAGTKQLIILLKKKVDELETQRAKYRAEESEPNPPFQATESNANLLNLIANDERNCLISLHRSPSTNSTFTYRSYSSLRPDIPPEASAAPSVTEPNRFILPCKPLIGNQEESEISQPQGVQFFSQEGYYNDVGNNRHISPAPISTPTASVQSEAPLPLEPEKYGPGFILSNLLPERPFPITSAELDRLGLQVTFEGTRNGHRPWANSSLLSYYSSEGRSRLASGALDFGRLPERYERYFAGYEEWVEGSKMENVYRWCDQVEKTRLAMDNSSKLLPDPNDVFDSDIEKRYSTSGSIFDWMSRKHIIDFDELYERVFGGDNCHPDRVLRVLDRQRAREIQKAREAEEKGLLIDIENTEVPSHEYRVHLVPTRNFLLKSGSLVQDECLSTKYNSPVLPVVEAPVKSLEKIEGPFIGSIITNSGPVAKRRKKGQIDGDNSPKGCKEPTILCDKCGSPTNASKQVIGAEQVSQILGKINELSKQIKQCFAEVSEDAEDSISDVNQTLSDRIQAVVAEEVRKELAKYNISKKYESPVSSIGVSPSRTSREDSDILLNTLWDVACRTAGFPPGFITVPKNVRFFLVTYLIETEPDRREGNLRAIKNLTDLWMQTCDSKNINPHTVQMPDRIHKIVFAHWAGIKAEVPFANDDIKQKVNPTNKETELAAEYPRDSNSAILSYALITEPICASPVQNILSPAGSSKQFEAHQIKVQHLEAKEITIVDVSNAYGEKKRTPIKKVFPVFPSSLRKLNVKSSSASIPSATSNPFNISKREKLRKSDGATDPWKEQNKGNGTHPSALRKVEETSATQKGAKLAHNTAKRENDLIDLDPIPLAVGGYNFPVLQPKILSAKEVTAPKEGGKVRSINVLPISPLPFKSNLIPIEPNAVPFQSKLVRIHSIRTPVVTENTTVSIMSHTSFGDETDMSPQGTDKYQNLYTNLHTGIENSVASEEKPKKGGLFKWWEIPEEI